ncbi:CMRF35-like molecule 1 [Chanodichthys erythropterus]|uniref:CMRF35-like molecule 1 n=1 Tax=Chanodichthys erythropterus TaxID=933992 RepID=UPI00351DEF78
MKFLLTVCVFLLTVISSLSVDITVRGMEGEPVIIKCPYAKGYEDSYKYFYKGVHRESVMILQSDGGKSKDRFSLQDDRQTRSFTVTISDLKMEDAGIYGCRAGWGEYKEIQLIVNRAPERSTPVQISTSTFYPDQTISSFSNYLRTSDTIPQSSSITITDHQISSSTGSVVIIVTTVVLVLLLIAVSLIIVAVQRK